MIKHCILPFCAAGIVGSKVNLDQPLTEAGLDSIGSVELRNAASALLGKELPATLAFDYPSVKAIAGYIVSQLQALSGGAADASSPRVASAKAADAVKQVWYIVSSLGRGYIYIL